MTQCLYTFGNRPEVVRIVDPGDLPPYMVLFYETLRQRIASEFNFKVVPVRKQVTGELLLASTYFLVEDPDSYIDVLTSYEHRP